MDKMKKISLACLLSFVLLTAFRCNKENTNDTVFRGKLMLKGQCMNYTISVISGNIDTGKVQASWTNPTTNITYQNVFRLVSICDFPVNLNEGDEFSFIINNNAPMDCVQCMAYYPTPQKGLKIKVVSGN